MLAENHGTQIARLIQLRREAMTLPNTEKAYERLAVQLKEIDTVKGPIVCTLMQERVAPILQDFTKISARSAGNWNSRGFLYGRGIAQARGWI